jgi:hypothetical protein
MGKHRLNTEKLVHDLHKKLVGACVTADLTGFAMHH